MKFRLILMLSTIGSFGFASSVETITDKSVVSGESERVVRLVLRSSMHDTSLYDFTTNARQQVAELQLTDSNGLITWVEQNIVPRVRRYLEEQPETERLLEENARIALYLDGSLVASDSNPIVMMIDRWTTQTPEDALVSAILYPSSIPMQNDECDTTNPQHLRRLALSASYGNLLAYHHLALWAHLNGSDAYGLPKSHELSYQEILFHEALKQFETRVGDLELSSHNDFQRRTLLLCMRDFRPGITTRSMSSFEGSEHIENEDPRLLFSIGVSEKKPKVSLMGSRKAGFLKARFHESRTIKDRSARSQELRRFKRDLKKYEVRSRSMSIGSDLFEKINAEVDESLKQLADKRAKRTIRASDQLSLEQVRSIAKVTHDIIINNK